MPDKKRTQHFFSLSYSCPCEETNECRCTRSCDIFEPQTLWASLSFHLYLFCFSYTFQILTAWQQNKHIAGMVPVLQHCSSRSALELVLVPSSAWCHARRCESCLGLGLDQTRNFKFRPQTFKWVSLSSHRRHILINSSSSRSSSNFHGSSTRTIKSNFGWLCQGGLTLLAS